MTDASRVSTMIGTLTTLAIATSNIGILGTRGIQIMLLAGTSKIETLGTKEIQEIHTMLEIAISTVLARRRVGHREQTIGDIQMTEDIQMIEDAQMDVDVQMIEEDRRTGDHLLDPQTSTGVFLRTIQGIPTHVDGEHFTVDGALSRLIPNCYTQKGSASVFIVVAFPCRRSPTLAWKGSLPDESIHCVHRTAKADDVEGPRSTNNMMPGEYEWFYDQIVQSY
jgi:hypothetical protein